MSTKKTAFFSIAFVLIFSVRSFGQQDMTVHFMTRLPQATYTNPAIIPDKPHKFFIGIPGISSIYANVGNSGFAYSDLIYKRSDDSLVLDMDKMIARLDKKNYLSTAVHVDLISFGFKAGKKNYFTVNVTEKANFRFSYPKDLISLAVNGNGQFLGEKADFEGIGLDAMHYREYGVSYAREITPRISAGLKLKYLYGMENVNTAKSDISIFTDDDSNFPITAYSDLEINTSFDTADIEVMNYLFKKKNTGLGFDLGGKYKFNEKLSVSASVIDLGKINWKQNTKNYINNSAEFTYDGISLNNFLNDSNLTEQFEELADSLKETFDLVESSNSYKTSLTPKFYLSGTYILAKKNKFGALVYGEHYHKKIHPGFSLNYTRDVGRWLSASVSYSMINRSYNNVGFGLYLKLGPFNIYAVSDNVFSVFYPQNTQTVHIHTGFQLVFGKTPKDVDRDGVIDKEDECPLDSGMVLFKGCPDFDRDGIIDKLDDCPIDSGLVAFQGCPDRDGDKIIDKLDDCPDHPGFEHFKGCPDTDNDSIIDKLDDCPTEKGLAYYNGCPDTDADGLIDGKDKCPTKAGPLDNNGCPLPRLFVYDKDGNVIAFADKNKAGNFIFENLPFDLNMVFKLEGEDTETINDINVIVSGNSRKALRDAATNMFKFELLPSDYVKLGKMEESDVPIKLLKEEEEILNKAFNNLEFNPAKNVIRYESYASLEELGKLLVKKPEWRLKISGHTDNVGKKAANMTLSKKRAEAVKKFLVDRGIKADRIIVKWYGDTVPIADNSTPEGKQKNRRVEMLIIE